MGLFDSFKKKDTAAPAQKVNINQDNPLVLYELQEPVERMAAAQNALDERAHSFLGRFAEDEVFDGILDVDEEWRCWLEADAEHSCLFFDDTLEVFGDAAYDHFMKNYSAELKCIGKDIAAIEKMGRSLDEYKIFKTALYNVFNNKNRLPMNLYFEQVYSRAKDYNMALERTSKESMNLTVSFRPLAEINRSHAYFDYNLVLEHNPEHGRDGYVYCVKFMEASSNDSMYTGPVELPVYGRYSRFESCINDHFLSERHSLYYYEAVKAQRVAEKEKHGIPADYFEGTFIDTKKLVDFSDKSYQYGNSKIFIPKSQVAFAGEKLYMKRWLYQKLKSPIERINQQEQEQAGSNLDDTLASASERSAETGTGKSETKEAPAK